MQSVAGPNGALKYEGDSLQTKKNEKKGEFKRDLPDVEKESTLNLRTEGEGNVTQRETKGVEAPGRD